MRIHVESRFPCPPDRFWDALGRTATLAEVSSPLVTFVPVAPTTPPERWRDLPAVLVRTKLFGLVALGVRTITIVKVDDVARTIETREHDAVVRRWDHRMTVVADGLSTLATWAFAQVLYRHRHRRWRRFVARDAEEGVVASRP